MLAALCSQRQRRCGDSDAVSAVQPATAALWRQRRWRCEDSGDGSGRCAASDDGAVKTATAAL
eukprot:1540465-Pleurochrysis_carterae.AAC.2